MNPKKLFFLFYFILLSLWSYSQKNVRTLNGDLLQKGATKNVNNYKKTIIYKTINEKNKDKILLINKYLDTTKRIIFKLGGNYNYVTMKELRNGMQPIDEGVVYGRVGDSEIQGYWDSILQVKIVKNQIKITTIIQNIDGTFIAKMKDNKLIISPKGYIVYASDRFIEILNDYHIPVLQVELDKKTNSIIIMGMFFQRLYCAIMADGGTTSIPYDKPYIYLSQPQKDSVLDECIETAKGALHPLHE